MDFFFNTSKIRPENEQGKALSESLATLPSHQKATAEAAAAQGKHRLCVCM